MSEKRDQIARNTTAILAVLVLVLVGVGIFQQVEIQNLRRADCADVAESRARSMHYDRLIEAWSQAENISDETRSRVVAAYRLQQVQVNLAAESSDNDGCRFLPQGGRE